MRSLRIYRERLCNCHHQSFQLNATRRRPMENTDTTFITSYKLSMTGQLEPCPHNDEDGSVYGPGEFDDLVPIGRRYGVRSTLAAPAREPG